MVRQHSLKINKQSIIKKRVMKIIVLTLLLLGAFIFILPFLWMLSTSFKEYDEIFTIPINFFPKKFTFQNYKEVFEVSQYANIFIGFRNTILITVPSTTIGCLTAALAAFAFAKIEFPGRDKIFYALIATMVIPGIITMIPSYMLFNKIGWVNTWLPLMIPGMFGGAGAVFFTRQHMKTIPKTLEDAARIDGLGWWGIFWRIELPLSKPILVTNFMFGFLGGYNDYVGPMLYLNTDSRLKTLQQMIAMLNDTFGTKWGVQMAGACIAIIPTIILFVFSQRYFVEGITLSGVKE